MNIQQASVPDRSGSNKRERLVAVVGATATGKTALAIDLARQFGGEIVSADSRQIYRGMTIGTAKPAAEDRVAVRHHLIDIRDPDEDFSLAKYLTLARGAIEEIQARGVLPLLVGGTAQYVFGVLEGWRVPAVPPRPALREQLEAEGGPALYARLHEVDPAAATKIGPRNLRRLVRALEVWEMTGRTITSWQEKRPPAYRMLRLGLTLPRELLHARIAARVDAMLAAGLVDEVASLLAQGYRPDLPAFNSMGYVEIIGYLRGAWSLAEARAQLVHNTHRFVRHQETWFRRDPAIAWVDVSDTSSAQREVRALAEDFMSG